MLFRQIGEDKGWDELPNIFLNVKFIQELAALIVIAISLWSVSLVYVLYGQ